MYVCDANILIGMELKLTKNGEISFHLIFYTELSHLNDIMPVLYMI